MHGEERRSLTAKYIKCVMLLLKSFESVVQNGSSNFILVMEKKRWWQIVTGKSYI